MMTGLRVPDGKYRGRFRGERGLETTRAWIGAREGVGPLHSNERSNARSPRSTRDTRRDRNWTSTALPR
jgi:hypothetical protein